MAISASNNSGGSSVNANINVTPMIDVMLVLLIIFMLVTPMIAAGFQATMPAAANVDSSQEEDTEIKLGVDARGIMFVNGEETPDDQVESKLRALLDAREDYHIVHFKADLNLPFRRIQQAVEFARQAGASNLVAIVDNKGGLGAMMSHKEEK